jgi:hypothetical protein
MIQRVQTLFLLGVTLISVLMLYLPVYELSAGGAAEVIQVDMKSSAILMILNCAIGTLCFAAIFMFKARNLQLRICNICMLLTCVLVGLLFFSADMNSGMNQYVHYLYGSYAPLIQLLFIFLATRFIKRDEELVRSADRLR